MNSIYTNNAEIVQFINRAQNKIADLSTLLVSRGMDNADAMYLLLELADFIEELDSCYCSYDEEQIIEWIHEYNHRANLNSIPFINITGFTTTVLTGNGSSLSLPITTADISDYVIATNGLIKKFNHNNLSGLQGGLPTERYHITKQMYDYLDNILNPRITSTVSLTIQPSVNSWPSGYFELGTTIPSVLLRGAISYGTYTQAIYVEYDKNGVALGSRNTTIRPSTQPNTITDSTALVADTTYQFSALFDNGLQQATQYVRFRQPMYYGIIKKSTPLTNIASTLQMGTKDVRDRGQMDLTFTLPAGNTLTDNYYTPYLFIPYTWGKFSSAINTGFEFVNDWTAQQVKMTLLDGSQVDGLYISYNTQIEGIATFKFNW